MARKPLWDGNRMGWDGGQFHQEYLAQSTWWMDTAECQGVVGQRKLFSVVAGKRNVSKVSPGLGLYQHEKSGICHTMVNYAMVVRTCRLLMAKSSRVRGSSYHSTFIVSCLTVSQTCLSCQPSGLIQLQSWTVVRAIDKM